MKNIGKRRIQLSLSRNFYNFLFVIVKIGSKTRRFDSMSTSGSRVGNGRWSLRVSERGGRCDRRIHVLALSRSRGSLRQSETPRRHYRSIGHSHLLSGRQERIIEKIRRWHHGSGPRVQPEELDSAANESLSFARSLLEQVHACGSQAADHCVRLAATHASCW